MSKSPSHKQKQYETRKPQRSYEKGTPPTDVISVKAGPFAVYDEERAARAKVPLENQWRGFVALVAALDGVLFDDRYADASQVTWMVSRDIPVGHFPGVNSMNSRDVHYVTQTKLKLRHGAPVIDCTSERPDCHFDFRFRPYHRSQHNGYNREPGDDVFDADANPRLFSLLVESSSRTTDAAFRSMIDGEPANPEWFRHRKRTNKNYDLLAPDKFMPGVLAGFAANLGVARIFYGVTAGEIMEVCPDCLQLISEPEIAELDNGKQGYVCPLCEKEVNDPEGEYMTTPIVTRRNLSPGLVKQLARDWSDGLPIKVPLMCIYLRSQPMNRMLVEGDHVINVTVQVHVFRSMHGDEFKIALPDGVDIKVDRGETLQPGDVFATCFTKQDLLLMRCDRLPQIPSWRHRLSHMENHPEFDIYLQAWFSGQIIMPIWDTQNIYVPIELMRLGTWPDLSYTRLMIDFKKCRSYYIPGLDGFVLPPIKIKRPFDLNISLPGDIRLDARISDSRFQEKPVYNYQKQQECLQDMVVAQEIKEAMDDTHNTIWWGLPPSGV